MNVPVNINENASSSSNSSSSSSSGGGDSVLPDAVVESVEIASFSSIPTQPAMLSNLAYSNDVASNNLSMQNAVANQQAMNELGQSVVGSTVGKVANLGPREARSAVDILTNNEVAQAVTDIKGAISAMASGSSGAAGGGGASGASATVIDPASRPVFYARLPLTLTFPGEKPDEVNVNIGGSGSSSSSSSSSSA